MEFVPEGQTVTNWTNLITLTQHYNIHMSLEDFLNIALENLEKRCLYTVSHEIIEKSVNELIYNVKIVDRENLIEFSTLRLLLGKESVWAVQYSTKEFPLSQNKIKTMLNFVKGAQMKTPEELKNTNNDKIK